MGSEPSKYDPVPPYDQDDLESTIPVLSNDQLSLDSTNAPTEATERGYTMNERTCGQQPESNVYCSKCNRHCGRLTERERCNYAALFVLMSLVASCIITSISVSAVHRGNN
jgi:hypothetical protein